MHDAVWHSRLVELDGQETIPTHDEFSWPPVCVWLLDDTPHGVTTHAMPREKSFTRHPVTPSEVLSHESTMIGSGNTYCMPARLVRRLCREAWVVGDSRVLAEAAHDPAVAEISR